jgi:hypothetical protein
MSFETFRNAIVSPALRAVADHWATARGDRVMPSWEQLQPARIAAQLPIIWVYKYDRQTREFLGRLAGDRISRYYGKNFRGLRLSDLHPPDRLPRMAAIMNRIVEEPALYSSSGVLFRQGDRTGTGERIILPLAGDGLHGDGVIGASDFDYPLANPDYAPVELISEGVTWVPLMPDMVAA